MNINLFPVIVILSAFYVPFSFAKNIQTVVVSGAIINTAAMGGVTKMNIGSVVGLKNAPSSLSQTVIVSRAIANTATGRGSKAEINIGAIVK